MDSGVGSGFGWVSSLHESQSSSSCLLRRVPQTSLTQSRLHCTLHSTCQHLPRIQQTFAAVQEKAQNVSCCVLPSNLKSKELMRRCSHKYTGRELLTVFFMKCVIDQSCQTLAIQYNIVYAEWSRVCFFFFFSNSYFLTFRMIFSGYVNKTPALPHMLAVSNEQNISHHWTFTEREIDHSIRCN